MTKEKIDQNLILKLTFDFSLLIIDFCEKLKTARKYVIARQLLKSGTSIGANAMEAQQALAGASLFLAWAAATAISTFVVWLIGRTLEQRA